MNKKEKILLIEKERILELRKDYHQRNITFWYLKAKESYSEGNIKKALRYWKFCKRAVMDFLIIDAKYNSIVMFRLNTSITYSEILKIKGESVQIKKEMDFYTVDENIKPAKYWFISKIQYIMKGGEIK